MSYGIDSPLTTSPPVTIEVAASHCHVPVEHIQEYAREGLLIPLRPTDGILRFTDSDYRWIVILNRLREEAHLSFDGIRELMLSRCACWKFRHCEFHNTKDCPLTMDSSKPCWVNRASWHVLASYPCYDCVYYRTLPYCAGIGTVLHGASAAAAGTDGDRGR